MDGNIFVDIAIWAGIMMLITVIIDWLKKLGIIKTPDAGKKWAGIIQTALSVILTLIGWLFPDWLNAMPLIDEIAGTFAELGAGVLALYPLIVKLGNLFHDVFSEVPVVSTLITHRID